MNQHPSRWCPRCSGSTRYDAIEDEMYCLNCGWRPLRSPTLPYVHVMSKGKTKPVDSSDNSVLQ